MTNNELDFGPLKKLVGVWVGDKGIDIAPEPDGEENNPYYETIVFTEVGDVTNAEEQLLTAVHYRQIVKRKSDDQVFHDETGYWMWDAKTQTVMHSFVIPRGVGVIAGGSYDQEKQTGNQVLLHVEAGADNKNWGIVQAPFMQQKARTTSFTHSITVDDNSLLYSETTTLEIYGKTFEHTDKNELVRQT